MFSEYKQWCKADTVVAREHYPAVLQATTLCQKSVTHITRPNAISVLLAVCPKHYFSLFIAKVSFVPIITAEIPEVSSYRLRGNAAGNTAYKYRDDLPHKGIL